MKTITNTNSVSSRLSQYKDFFGKAKGKMAIEDLYNFDPEDGLAVLDLIDSLNVQMLEKPEGHLSGVVEGLYSKLFFLHE